MVTNTLSRGLLYAQIFIEEGFDFELQPDFDLKINPKNENVKIITYHYHK